MKHFRTALLALAALPLTALAADSSLLSLMMPDAKVIAGLRVDSTKSSPFGQYVLSHMQLEDQGFKDFVTQTGFDPRRDVSELVIASNWQSNSPASRWLVAAKGTFDSGKILSAAKAHGAVVQNFQGVTIFSGTGKNQSEPSGMAFLDNGSAVMGDVTSVEAAIQRRQTNAPADSALLAKIRNISATNDFWFATLVPVSEFAASMPNENLQGAMQGNLMQGITQASGGIRFGSTVNITGEAITRSDKDAQALVDVIRFVMGMLQQNKGNNPTAGQVSSLLDTMDLRSNGTVVSMALALPEKTLEDIMGTAPHAAGQARPRHNAQPVH